MRGESFERRTDPDYAGSGSGFQSVARNRRHLRADLIRKDGSRSRRVSVTALRDDQDAIIGYLLIGTDNTARKQVEEEQTKLDQRLRDQQFYTRSLIESNIDALMTTDPSDHYGREQADGGADRARATN